MQVDLGVFVQMMVLTAVVGITGAAFQFRYWLQLSQRLDVSFFRRDVSRRVVFRGLINGDAESLRLLRKLRLAAFVTVLPFVILGGLLFIAPLVFVAVCCFFAILLSKPYEMTSEISQ